MRYKDKGRIANELLSYLSLRWAQMIKKFIILVLRFITGFQTSLILENAAPTSLTKHCYQPNTVTPISHL